MQNCFSFFKKTVPIMINETSLARSATLGDTSWDRLTIELASWNLSDSQLCLESKTDPSLAKGGGDTALKTDIYWKGGHRTYLIEVGTLHRPYHTVGATRIVSFLDINLQFLA